MKGTINKKKMTPKTKKAMTVEELDRIGNTYKSNGVYVSPEQQLLLPVGKRLTLKKHGPTVQS